MLAEHLIFSYSDFTPGLKQGYNCESVGKKESEREREMKGKRERERKKNRKEREGRRESKSFILCPGMQQNIPAKHFFKKLLCKTKMCLLYPSHSTYFL